MNRQSDIVLRQPVGSVRPAHPIKFTLSVAGVLGIVVGLIVTACLAFQLDNDTTLYFFVATFVGAIITITLAQAALVYGVSRSLDGRPARHNDWWATAQNGFMDTVNVTMMSLIGSLSLILIGSLVQHALLVSLNAADAIALPVLIALNVALVWLLLGMYSARRIGAAAVIVGRLTAWQGFKTGFRLYRKAGGHFLVAMAEIWLGRLSAFLIVGLIISGAIRALDGASDTTLAVGCGAVAAITTALATFVILEIEARIWLHQYRAFVMLLDHNQQVGLTAGRAARHTT